MNDFEHKIKELLKEQKTGLYKIKDLNLLKIIRKKDKHSYQEALDSFVYFIEVAARKPLLQNMLVFK